MELRHLRYFIAAAEEEHFGRASDRLCVTRPAVSQIISDLESELGMPLFERLAHRVRLTAAGRALLPELQALMTDLSQAIVKAKRVGQGKTGSLNIGYGSLTLMNSLFRTAIKQFRELYPEVTLSLLEMPTPEQPRALAEKKSMRGSCISVPVERCFASGAARAKRHKMRLCSTGSLFKQAGWAWPCRRNTGLREGSR